MLRWATVCVVSVASLLSATLPALAQSGGGYDLSHNVVSNGGATFSTGGATRAQVRAAITDYIAVFYNGQRLHSYLHHSMRMEYEQEFMLTAQNAA
jgi:Integrase core domain